MTYVKEKELTQDEKRRLQSTCLEIMLDLFDLCNKYHLTIMLGGGSALGAVRHKGFIPWDDDVDLNMPREDFEKLKEVFDKELGNKYTMYAPNYVNKAYNRFAKIEKNNTEILTLSNLYNNERHGISVDIFVIENIPQNFIYRYYKGFLSTVLMFAASQSKFYNLRNSYWKSTMTNTFKGTLTYYVKCFFGFLFHFLPTDKWYDLIDKHSQYHGKTNLRGVPSGRKHYFGEIFDSSVYFPVKQGSFEGKNVSLPNRCDIYLSNLYGDYMKIPPIEKRENHCYVKVDFGD